VIECVTDKLEIPIPPLAAAQIVVHVIGVILIAGCILCGLAWLVINWKSFAPPWFVCVTVVLFGLFLSDFFSGLLHWGFDTWFTDNSPLIRRVLLTVREYHVYPQNIFGYKFYYEAGAVSWISLTRTLPVIGAVAISSDSPTLIRYGIVSISVIVSVFTLFMLQFHKLGHRRVTSPILITLQRAHLLMSVQHHSQHRREKHDIKYCLINGWADFVCDRIGFWRGAESAVHWITGTVPRSNDEAWIRRYPKRYARTFFCGHN
jgi:hypothetical protein